MVTRNQLVSTQNKSRPNHIFRLHKDPGLVGEDVMATGQLGVRKALAASHCVPGAKVGKH